MDISTTLTALPPVSPGVAGVPGGSGGLGLDRRGRVVTLGRNVLYQLSVEAQLVKCGHRVIYVGHRV